MASTVVEFRSPTGKTLTIELYPYGSDTIANGAGGDSATEATNRKGLYTATVTEAISGWHTAHIMESGSVIAVFDVLLQDDTNTYRCHDRPQESLEPTTQGNTLDVTSTGAAGIDWGNVENQSTVVDLSATDIQLCDTVTTVTTTSSLTGHTPQTADHTASIAAILLDTGTTLENHLTDIKGTGFAKDTHSLTDIEGYVDLIDDGTSGLAKIATDVAAVLVDTAEIGAAGAGLTVLATAANLATVDTVVDGIKTVTDNLPDSGALTSIAQGDTMEGFFQVTLRSDAAITTDRAAILTLINADEGSGVGDYTATTESQEALRDRGDASWTTAAGFSTHSAADVWTAGSRTLTAATNITSDASAITMSSAGVVGTVNLVNTTTTNTDMVGTDGAFLAASAPANFSSLVISAGGAADCLVQGFLNNTIAETTADNIAANFETFYDNADALTAQTVDDVGSGGGGGGDATAANQTTIISHLTDIKGTGFVTDTHSLPQCLTATGFSTHTAANVRTEIDSNSTQLAAIVADTNELQTDWADAGRLDAILDARASQASVDALNDLSQADIRTATGLASANLDIQLSAIDSVVDAILVDTDTTIPALIAVVDTNVDSILVDTGTTIPAQITALNDISVADILTTQMTESYAANGTAPTLAEATFAIHQMLMQFIISGTTYTVRKLDNSTTAFVVTLDDANDPTSAVRT